MTDTAVEQNVLSPVEQAKQIASNESISFEDRIKGLKDIEKLLTMQQVELMSDESPANEAKVDELKTYGAIILQLRKNTVIAHESKKIEEERNKQRSAFADKILAIVNPSTLTEEQKPVYDEIYKFMFDKAPIKVDLPSNGKAPSVAREAGAGTKKSQIHELLKTGSLTHDEIVAKGFNTDTVRSVAWEYGFNKDDNGVYFKKHLDK